MARPKKDGQYVNFYMDRDVFEMLEKFSKDFGLTKTVIMERAVKQYISFALAVQKQSCNMRMLDTSTSFVTLLTADEFYAKYCMLCGSQRCGGVGSEYFDGCVHSNELL